MSLTRKQRESIIDWSRVGVYYTPCILGVLAIAGALTTVFMKKMHHTFWMSVGLGSLATVAALIIGSGVVIGGLMAWFTIERRLYRWAASAESDK